jgi:hypothetical protein
MDLRAASTDFCQYYSCLFYCRLFGYWYLLYEYADALHHGAGIPGMAASQNQYLGIF